MTRRALLVSLGMAAAVSACGGSPASSPTAQPAPPGPAAPAAPSAPAATGATKPAGEVKGADEAVNQVVGTSRTKYDPKGRRDPFQSLEIQVKEPAAGGAMIANTKLTGIVRGQTTIVLIETSEGVGYIMKPGDTLGDGRLVEIGQDSAVFAVAPRPGSTTNRVVLTIAKD